MKSLRAAEAVLLLFTTTLSCFRTQREFTFAGQLSQTNVVLLLPPQSYSFAVNRRLSQLNHVIDLAYILCESAKNFFLVIVQLL
jgi:hypothetical protein